MRGVVALQPASWVVLTTHASDVRVPMFWSSGTSDYWVRPLFIRRSYNKDTVGPKVFTEYKGMNHKGDTDIGPNHLLGYYCAFLRCTVKEEAEACDLVFGNT